MWAISPQETEQNQALRERRSLPFPILADADQVVIRTWGIYNRLDPKQRSIPYPATYIIDQSGRVRWSRLGLETRDRPTAGEVVAAVRGAD